MTVGAIEGLCNEIGFRFLSGMEHKSILLSFVSVLVDEIRDQVEMLESLPFRAVSPQSKVLMDAVRFTLVYPTENNINWCREEAYPTNDENCEDLICLQLDSCVSAIEFGLEDPCHSRHTAEAAFEIWKVKYTPRIQDRNTTKWAREWACDKMAEALLKLATTQSPDPYVAKVEVSLKPHLGKIEGWYKQNAKGGLGYTIGGMSLGHPVYDKGPIRTSYVVKHEGDEIETNNSRYTLTFPMLARDE